MKQVMIHLSESPLYFFRFEQNLAECFPLKKIAGETWSDLIIFLFPFLSIICTEFSYPFSISSHFTYSRNLILFSLSPSHLLFLVFFNSFLVISCYLYFLYSAVHRIFLSVIFSCHLTSLVVPVISVSGNTLSWKYNCLYFKYMSSVPVLKSPIP